MPFPRILIACWDSYRTLRPPVRPRYKPLDQLLPWLGGLVEPLGAQARADSAARPRRIAGSEFTSAFRLPSFPARTAARSFSYSRDGYGYGAGIWLTVEGAKVFIADIYDRPLPTILDRIHAYWRRGG
jgi:hypothetical protein